MGNVITLTTDFGLTDAYVAVMKGVILSINPQTRLVDICHTVKPQNILQGAFILSTAYQFFPQRTIHVVVVDPGVGTERKAIILRTPTYDFVAPDNGVLSYIMEDSSIPPKASQQVAIASPLKAVAITNQKYWRSPVSATFHGRDIFAPVAAHLSLGVPLEEFGEALDSLTVIPVSQPQPTPEGGLTGRVLHIDNFGNLITNIKESDIPQGTKMEIKVGGRQISGVSRIYGDTCGLLALIGSSGHLEIALREGNARDLLNAEIGDTIRIKPLREVQQ
ncbi:MAG: SAM-dependent chlorinase/fluorinase [Chloroflexi bacterium]|nr:SAM-dependent chlorinase/fluorinase [Chloroflexota bacterium]